MALQAYSTKKISKTLVRDIKESLRKVEDFGSIEIYVQNNKVTQITTRNIKKTNRRSITENKSV